ncbi:allergen Cr-PI-like [Schistocerca americana]|uniref:allergen Cr-PI-like n=1 Tax=Schistocerca americana TaxID=7009 RepID=UPI001F4FCB20|nr:allergen Cr-PI-like [Schistocerca americana]
MRTAAALCILLAVVAAAAAAPNPEGEKAFLTRQRDILRLFVKIQQPAIIPEHIDIIKSFKWEEIIPKLQDKAPVERFLQLRKEKVLLPRKEDFSILYSKHLWQAVQLFKVLYHIPDYDTFHKVAVWLRYNVNEGLYEYVLRVVLLHRDDTKDLLLPPPYEVLPQFFVSADVLQEAYDACLRGLCAQEDHPYVIRANYTGSRASRNPEARLSYFREDVGLASYMAFMGLQYIVPWVNATECPWPVLRMRGDLYYFLLRNLLARYDLERLSHHLLPVRPVELWEPVSEGYDPQLRLLSGREAAARPEGLRPSHADVVSVDDVISWERRVRDAAATALFLKEKKLEDLEESDAVNRLASIVMGGPSSPAPNYYRSVSWGLQALYGHIADPLHEYGMAPSALDHHLTMYRDPLYYRIIKRVYGIFEVYKNNLPPYRIQELTWDGVKITEVKVEKLVTFFDDFDIRLDNAIDVAKIEDIRKTNVVARQHRLNHKPFSYSLKVSSDKEQLGLLRVFLGPSGAWEGGSLSLDDMRHQFLVIDGFHVKLKPGDNTIVRKSREMLSVSGDPSGFRELYQRVEAALGGGERLSAAEERLRLDGYPNRLLLPRGRPAGLPLDLFVVLTDAREPAWPGQVFSDGRDPFFPFDRRVPFWELKTVPNAHFEPVTVFHRLTKDGKSSEK